MADIDGGALSFKSVMDNDQMNTAIEETLRRVQGLSDGTVAGGKKMDTAFDTTAESIRAALGQIGAACETHEAELSKLEAEYQRLGQNASAAFMAGRDDEYNAIANQQTAIRGEIVTREKLLKGLREQSDALEREANEYEVNAKKAERNAQGQVSLRTQIKQVKDEMASLVAQAKMNGQVLDETTGRYAQLKDILGDLTDVQNDMQAQASILANDQKTMQGLISGITGFSGAFTAATGVISLFAGENEDLQKVMVKVQSLMSITIGLQQVQQTLDKDSAFQLVTMRSLKEWWAGVVAKATIAEQAETVAIAENTSAEIVNAAATTGKTVAEQSKTAAITASTGAETANAVATTGQTVAATAGTAANVGLAGAFRLVGAAIKSIPGIGWVIAGISALIGVVAHFAKQAKQAKKEQDEFSKAMIEGCYKPIGSIETLSNKYSALGDNMAAKQKFIEDNQKALAELGVSVKDVTDAENILIANKDKYIEAQIAKATAAVYLQQTNEKLKKKMQLEAEIATMHDTKTRVYADGSGTYQVENRAKAKKQKELADLKVDIKKGYENAAEEETRGLGILKDAGIIGTETYVAGTVGAIEQAISVKQAALKLLTNSSDYKAAVKEIAMLQKQLDGITGKKSTDNGKDAFLTKLDKYKSEYARYLKWINSGDATITKAADKEFASLLKQGATYIDYLARQRDTIENIDPAKRTSAQNKHLRQLNDSIAEETKKTVLETFNNELSEQLTNAKTVMEMLNIIEQKRKTLKNDGSDLDNSESEVLDNAEKSAVEKQKQETDALLSEYGSYLDNKLLLERQYANDIALLTKRRDAATTDERASIDAAIANRRSQYAKDSKTSGNADYDQMLQDYATFEEKKTAIIGEYNEKRKLAEEQGNQEMIARLNTAQAKAISALASDELTGSDTWAKLFGNLDDLTASEIDTLIKEIEAKFDTLSGIFDPVDLAEIRQKLNEAKDVLLQDNPFAQLGESLKAIFKGAADDSKESAEGIKRNWNNLADATEKSFAFVTDAIDQCDFLKDAIGDVGATAIASLATLASVSVSVATAIKTAETASVILAVIQAALMAIQVVIDVVDAIINDKTAKINKNIKQHEKALKGLERQYDALERATDKALGTDYYAKQQEQISNLQKQIAEIEAQRELESSKKKADSDKIDEYNDKIEDTENQIENIQQAIVDDLMTTTVKDLANEVANSIVSAWESGEDAAKAFNTTVNNVMKNVVKNLMLKNVIEKELQGLTSYLESALADYNLTDEEIAEIDRLTAEANKSIDAKTDAYEKAIKHFGSDSDTASAVEGAVKGITSEQASMLGGQMNAMRINQLDGIAILRQQLMALNQITNNTAYCVNLAKLGRIVEIMENRAAAGDSLRGQGLL